jgi:hypothetical protein
LFVCLFEERDSGASDFQENSPVMRPMSKDKLPVKLNYVLGEAQYERSYIPIMNQEGREGSFSFGLCF